MAQDVVVVGGGIAGLAIGWELATRPGLLPEGVRADRWLRVTEGHVAEGR